MIDTTNSFHDRALAAALAGRGHLRTDSSIMHGNLVMSEIDARSTGR
jgi:hypothetical protein